MVTNEENCASLFIAGCTLVKGWSLSNFTATPLRQSKQTSFNFKTDVFPVCPAVVEEFAELRSRPSSKIVCRFQRLDPSLVGFQLLCLWMQQLEFFSLEGPILDLKRMDPPLPTLDATAGVFLISTLFWI
jgi:hypothetical protein